MWAGPALLHQDRDEPRVRRAGRQQAGQHPRPEPRVQVVDIRLENDAPRGRLGRRAAASAGADQHPGHVRPAGGVAAAGTARRTARSVSDGRSSQRLGAARSPAPSRSGWSARRSPRPDPPAAGQLDDRRHRHRRSAVRRAHLVPEPTATSAGAEPSSIAEVVQRRADADDVGDGVQRPDLVEVHVLGRDAVHPGLGGGQPGEHRAAPGPAPVRRGAAARAASRIVRQVRCGGSSTRTSTSTLVARSPARVTACGASRTAPGTTASTARCTVPQVRAGVDQGAEQHVAGDAGGGVDPGVPSRRHRARCAGAGDLGGEVAGAVTVVDVDHGHARRAGVEHGQQGGQPLERGAVARPRSAPRPPVR